MAAKLGASDVLLFGAMASSGAVLSSSSLTGILRRGQAVVDMSAGSEVISKAWPSRRVRNAAEERVEETEGVGEARDKGVRRR